MSLPTKNTTVYSGPGYPIDPLKERVRQLNDIDRTFQCVMKLPRQPYHTLYSQTLAVEIAYPLPNTKENRAKLWAERFLG